MAFIQDPGGGGPGPGGGVVGGGVGGGAGSGGAGGPGPGQGNPTFAAARDLALALSPDLNSLIVTLTPNGKDSYNENATYVIYWLDPTIFSINNVPQAIPGVNLKNGRKMVPISFSGGTGVVSGAVPYSPYSTGGWMYAVVLNPGSPKELTLNGTNYVPVPVLGPAAEPLLATVPTNIAVRWTVTSGVNRLVQFAWTNPQTPPSYIKITAIDYWADNCQRDIAIFKVNTPPGGHQGFTGNGGYITTPIADTSQGVILETDGAGHNITWYFVPMNAGLTPLHLTACPNGTTSYLQ